MQLTDTIRIGLVGAGANTQARHIPGFQAQEGVELVCVANRTPDSSRRVAEKFSIATIKESWRQVVESSDVDAVCIGTWPYLHCEVTCAALEAGKHVLCEARMAMNLQEATTMLETSKSHPDLVAQIVPSPFGFRVDRTIKELIAKGWLGEVLVLNLRETGRQFADPEAPLHWRHRPDLSGLNRLTMGIWYETAMRWVGHARSVCASAKTCVQKRKHPDTGELMAVGIPDHLNVLVDFESGVAGNLQFSAVTGLGRESGAGLFGTEGTLKYDALSETLWGGKKGSQELSEISIDPSKAGLWRVEEEFINAVRGQEKVTLTDFETGVRYMEFTEAVERSCLEGKKVELPL